MKGGGGLFFTKKRSNHIDVIISKANKMLGMIKSRAVHKLLINV